MDFKGLTLSYYSGAVLLHVQGILQEFEDQYLRMEEADKVQDKVQAELEVRYMYIDMYRKRRE